MDKRTPAIMLQGTGSNVGKSVLVAGLCRVFARRGLTVRPFKPQNMSNNAAATQDGGEIGRAQALQARACGVEPSVHMNPVLLKPETDTGAQVIVQGKRFGSMRAREYGSRKAELMPKVLESFAKLGNEADLIVVEGAGSPAEVNLRKGDIANMGFAEAADVPVILIGDIDRGGIIASFVGTHAVLQPSEAMRIKGFITNKFRGDVTLFADGAKVIAEKTGWADIGTLPFFQDAKNLPAEDILDIGRTSLHHGSIKIAALVLKRIANFDDLDPLRLDPTFSLKLVQQGEAIPGDCDWVIIPGSKSTIADLKNLRKNGWDIDLKAHHRRGGRILGLCGGYQMLGTKVLDPDGVEGIESEADGLGLLDVETVLAGEKITQPAQADHLASGTQVAGYEIHMGGTDGPDRTRPLFEKSGIPEGAICKDGLVMGSYLHGMFARDNFRAAFFGATADPQAMGYDALVDQTLDALADHLEQHLDIDTLSEIACLKQHP